MKIVSSESRARALTLMEVLIVVAALMILAAAFLSALMRPTRHPALRIQCVNNLKQVGLAYRIWEGDNGDRYPMAISETNGGTMELITGTNAFRHFLVMSNELSTPKILFCPAESDQTRTRANDFAEAQSLFDPKTGVPIAGPISFLNNSNISYFVGVDVPNETNAAMILSGDHNITNGAPISNGILQLTTNHESSWTAEVHNEVGNLLLADGSVQQLSSGGLQTAVANTGFETNRLQMPVLGP